MVMIEQSVYGASLLVSLGCLLLIDHRWKLAIFGQTGRSFMTLGYGVLFFAMWDALGIAQNIFYTGSATVISRIFIVPNFPIEEILFLIVLVYTTLIIWRSLERRS